MNLKSIGISTSCVQELTLYDALECLSRKTDFVEIMSAANHFLPDNIEVPASFSLRYSVHSPTSDGNIAEPFERLRQASLEVLYSAAEDAAAINAETLVIHPGFCLEPERRQASAAALKKSIRDLGHMQEEFSLRFVMENLGSWDCCHFRYPDLLPDIREAGLGFCLDIGHANLTGTLPAFLAEKPDHIHLHDNHGEWDEHAACGSGTIDFADVCTLRAPAVIECMEYSAALSSLEYLKKYIRV